MKNVCFAAAAALALSACGAGGGNPGATHATSPGGTVLETPITPYVGTWVSACDDHEIDTAVITRPAGKPSTIVINYKAEFYANLNCTGSVVGTWTQSADVTAEYTATIDAAVALTGGAASTIKVDTVSVTLPAHTESVVGSNVTHVTQNGQLQWCIDFGGGSATCIRDQGALPARTVNAGLHLRGNEMFELSLVNNTYVVDGRYTRK